ncbi:MAG TPA: hypothetical protein VM688_04750, partial [Nocardioidaceae bacterium]|nr:hypothetical protein [Nocardioidaceae bacterium]
PSPSERSPIPPPAGPPRAPSPAERGEADMPPGSPPPSPHTDDAARAQVPSVSALGSAQAAALDRDRTASSPPDTSTAPDADQPTVPPPSASAARAPEAPRPRPGGLRRLRWVFAVLIALVGAAAAAYAVRPRNPQPSSSAAPSSSPADRARRVHVSSRAYEATLPAGWRTVCRDVEGTCFGVSLPSGAHRSAFLLGSGKDTSTVTIDRTPLKGARVNSASIIGDVEAKHAGDRGFRRLPGFPREVRLRRRSARELRFSTGDQRGSQAVVVYGFVERGSAYVLTGTSTRGTAAMTATKMAAGTLLTH